MNTLLLYVCNTINKITTPYPQWIILSMPQLMQLIIQYYTLNDFVILLICIIEGDVEGYIGRVDIKNRLHETNYDILCG